MKRRVFLQQSVTLTAAAAAAGFGWSQESALRVVLRGGRSLLAMELPSTLYRARSGRSKLVRYWAMRRLGGEFRPNREVDEIRWVPA